MAGGPLPARASLEPPERRSIRQLEPQAAITIADRSRVVTARHPLRPDERAESEDDRIGSPPKAAIQRPGARPDSRSCRHRAVRLNSLWDSKLQRNARTGPAVALVVLSTRREEPSKGGFAETETADRIASTTDVPTNRTTNRRT